MGRGKRKSPRKLGAKLREIRSRLGLGQVEMAGKLQKADPSVYPGLVSRFEHGKLEPSLLVLLEYARLTGVSMETLVDDKKVLHDGVSIRP